MLPLTDEITDGMTLSYNKRYIGTGRDGIADLSMIFRPGRDCTLVDFRIPRSEEVTALIDDSGADSAEYEKRYGYYRLRLTGNDFTERPGLLLDLIRRASSTPTTCDE